MPVATVSPGWLRSGSRWRSFGGRSLTWAQAPEGVTAPVQYGPRAAAIGVYLWHGQFMSRDRACQAMADLFGAPPRRARWLR